jgi:hypothetical protein
LATHLTITIHAMVVLPPAELAAVLDWVEALTYPWCAVEELQAEHRAYNFWHQCCGNWGTVQQFRSRKEKTDATEAQCRSSISPDRERH